MEFSLKKSYMPHGSFMHTRRVSASEQTSEISAGHEEIPILLDQESPHHDQGFNMSSVDNTPVSRREVTVKMDGVDANDDHRYHQREYSTSSSSNNKIMRNGEKKSGSFEFRQQSGGDGGVDDPPSKLIGQFLNKQKSKGEIALDMDLEMEELNQYKQASSPPYSSDQSREIRVSFDPSPVESMRRRYKDCPEGGDQTYSYSQVSQQQRQHHREQSFTDTRRDEVLRCTSNASFNRNVKHTASLTTARTRSRLQDPPPEEIIELRSGLITKSIQMKSGLLGTINGAEEDDDPLLSEDFPEEYRMSKFSAMTFIQWVSLVLIVAALFCSLSVHELKQITLWDLKLWKWEVMVLVLICGRLVSGWGIRLIVFFIERNFVLRKKLLYFVYGVRKPVQNCLWLGLGLLTWDRLFDRKVKRETRSRFLTYITKILVCLLTGTLLWLVKTLMVKVLASSFHVSTYFDRIQESLFYQYVIETLSGSPLIEIQMNNEDVERTAAEVHKLQNDGAFMPPDLRDVAFPGAAKSGRVIGKSSRHKGSVKLSGASSKRRDDGITIDHLHKLNPKNVSAWNMKRLMNMVRHGSLSTLDEQVLSGTANEDDSANEIRSEYEAKAAARKIFLNVARHGSKYIYLEDLMRFMQEEEALKTMGLFEGATEHKRISKSALKMWVVNAFRERKALALTLNDTKTAVNKLHHIVNITVGIIILVIWLLILKIATSQFLLFLSSQLVLVAFVFGNTCKTIFEALIFLFVIHPFDVGDRCEIDGVQMIVEEMNILTTMFLRYDNLKIIFPNSVLATKPINNFYRSPDMLDEIQFCIHISTPPDKIALIRQRIVGYIEGKKEHWCPAPIIIMKDVENFTRLRMAIWPTHKMNHQNMVERWERRALLVEEMVKIFREVDVQYRLLPLDINVRSVPQPPVVYERLPSTWKTANPN